MSDLEHPVDAAAFASPEPSSASGPASADRPELAIGGAFAGGLVLALILKRIAS